MKPGAINLCELPQYVRSIGFDARVGISIQYTPEQGEA